MNWPIWIWFFKIKYSATSEKFSKPNLEQNQNKVQIMRNISAAFV